MKNLKIFKIYRDGKCVASPLIALMLKTYVKQVYGDTCLSPPPLPPVKSIVSSVETGPPPATISLLVCRMRDLIAFKILPYVAPCPFSMAWMKANVIAPVEVTFDSACPVFNICQSFF